MPEVLAVLDTCVLYPAPLYNTLLYIAFHRVYQPLWTDRILVELRRTMLTDGRKSPEQVERRLRAMTASFEPGANLDRRGIAYASLIEQMPNHPKDRHVLAAAVAIECDYLVTANLRDFRLVGTPYQTVNVVSPDDLLIALAFLSRRHQLNILSALHAQVRDSRRFASLDALLERLVQHHHTTRFAARMLAVRAELASLPADLAVAITEGQRITDEHLSDLL
jgi:hypothetical protein